MEGVLCVAGSTRTGEYSFSSSESAILFARSGVSEKKKRKQPLKKCVYMTMTKLIWLVSHYKIVSKHIS